MDNFDLRKYLAEGRLFKENLNLDIGEDDVTLDADSGEYYGEIEDGKVSFSVVYEDEEDRGGMEFDEDNWKDILGPNHAFVEIASKIPTEVEALDDYVMIKVNLEDLKGITDSNGGGRGRTPQDREKDYMAVAYLRNAFQQYLKGGNTFKGAPGDVETIVWDSEEYGDDSQFRSTLQQLSNGNDFAFDVPKYGEVTFKRKGNAIIGSFIMPEQ